MPPQERGRRFAATFVDGEGIEASDVYRDETFGPICAIATFRGDDDAVRKHNDTDFGLTASAAVVRRPEMKVDITYCTS